MWRFNWEKKITGQEALIFLQTPCACRNTEMSSFEKFTHPAKSFQGRIKACTWRNWKIITGLKRFNSWNPFVTEALELVKIVWRSETHFESGFTIVTVVTILMHQACSFSELLVRHSFNGLLRFVWLHSVLVYKKHFYKKR